MGARIEGKVGTSTCPATSNGENHLRLGCRRCCDRCPRSHAYSDRRNRPSLFGHRCSDYIGIGQFGDVGAIGESRHEVYNNIILARDGRPLGRDTWAYTAAEVYDGNVYRGWSNPSPSTYASIWRFLHSCGAMDVDGENPLGSIGDVDKLRDLARGDSRWFYAPGWEAAGLFVDPQLQVDYRPLNPALASGAVDLTATGWPGTNLYKPWRGAVPP